MVLNSHELAHIFFPGGTETFRIGPRTFIQAATAVMWFFFVVLDFIIHAKLY